jgi:hypothetical protein
MTRSCMSSPLASAWFVQDGTTKYGWNPVVDFDVMQATLEFQQQIQSREGAEVQP